MRSYRFFPLFAIVLFAIVAPLARAADHSGPGDHAAAAQGHVAQSLQDLEILAKQGPAYPLTTCLVSGDKLGGDMGAGGNYIYKDRLIKFCCSGCIKPFEAKADEYIAKLDKAAKEHALAKDKPDAGAVKSPPAPAGLNAGQDGGCCK